MKINISNLLNNLLDLTKKFYSGEKLSAKEISKIYDVNIRTAQRYPKYLQEAGLNLKKEKNKWYLDVPSYNVDDIEEIAKVFSLSYPIINILRDSIYYSKINVEHVKNPNIFEKLEKAIKHQNIIEFKHEEYKYPFKQIKPIKIVNFEGFWYLLTLNEKDEYRRFYINSISDVKLINKTFNNEKKIIYKINKINEEAINIWYEPDAKPRFIKLYLDEVAAKYFKRLPPFKYRILEENDNTLFIEVKITHSMEIIPFILKWIPHIKVLDKELQQEIDERIKEFKKTTFDV